MLRRFCSTACCNKARKDPKLFPRELQPPFAVTDRALEYRGRKHLKDACEKCGGKMALQSHHMNGIKADNDPSNIMTLCKKCHDRLHAGQQRKKHG